MKSKSVRRLAASIALTGGILVATPLAATANVAAPNTTAASSSSPIDVITWVLKLLGDPGCC